MGRGTGWEPWGKSWVPAQSVTPPSWLYWCQQGGHHLVPFLPILGTSNHSPNSLACSLSPSQCPQDLLHHHLPRGPSEARGAAWGTLPLTPLEGVSHGVPLQRPTAAWGLGVGAPKIIPEVLGVCGITWGVLVGFRGSRGGDYAAPPPPLQPLVGVGCNRGLGPAALSIN